MTGHEKMDKVGEELLGVVKRAYGPNIAVGVFDHFEEAIKQMIKEEIEAEREACAMIADREIVAIETVTMSDGYPEEGEGQCCIDRCAIIRDRIRARSS